MRSSFKNYGQSQKHRDTISPPIHTRICVAGVGEKKKDGIARRQQDRVAEKKGERSNQPTTQHDHGDDTLHRQGGDPKSGRRRVGKIHRLHWQPTRKPHYPQAGEPSMSVAVQFALQWPGAHIGGGAPPSAKEEIETALRSTRVASIRRTIFFIRISSAG